ncbi:unnamed protein product [Dicrocoelium dendriticum]|nr:unnamed protein product [Dicrocoelium dendriticum]
MSSNVNECTYCLQKVKGVYFKCSECPRILLCLLCYCSGAEAGTHKKIHGYSIETTAQGVTWSIFGGWTADEERHLLDALEHYGVGNWEDASLKVETRSPTECMQHYCDYYLNSILGRDLKGDDHTSRVTDHTNQSLHLSPSFLQTSPTVDVEIEDQQLLGYMPARGDFERDYDNDAESILCRLYPSFSHDDLEDALKVAQVGIYMQRLRERQRRKEISREHGLIAQILAFILNKRIKKRAPWRGCVGATPKTHVKRRGRPPLRRSFPLEKLTGQKDTPIKRSSIESNVFSSEYGSQNPPPGSWLAAPFVLKSSGASRGTPIVASGLSVNANASANVTHTATAKWSTDTCNATTKEKHGAVENHTSLCLNDKLKPFLRYFTGPQGKHFMDSLFREEQLKHEIKYLLDYRSKGKGRLNGTKPKIPPFKSSVYTGPPKPLPDLNTIAPTRPSNWKPRKRRRALTTPWYVKVQRRARQSRR